MDEKNMRNIPVYPYGSAFARESGELEQYRASRNADKDCGKAIEQAVNSGWDGFRLPDDTAQGILEQFGAERTAYVLATAIQLRETDERFSRSNRDWAQSIPMFAPVDNRWSHSFEIHSLKLDDFITKARRDMGRIPELEERAKALKALPVYPHSWDYASENKETVKYWSSYYANVACKEALDSAIARYYRGNSLDTKAATLEVVGLYGFDRTLHVLANSIRHVAWDGRISRSNVQWAQSMPVTDQPDRMGHDNSQDYRVGKRGSHGLTNLLVTAVRKEYALEQERTAAQEQPENPLKNAELLTEDDASMIDGIINNGAKDNGPPKAEQSSVERQEDRKPQGKQSIRAQLAEKPPEQEKAGPKPRSREAAL